MTLTRKTPMKRGTLRGVTDADLPDGLKLRKPRATTIKPSARRKARTKAMKLYMSRVAAICCIACRANDIDDTPAELHHPRTNAGAGQKAPDSDVLPLCPAHHRGTMHPTVASIHLDRLGFIKMFGTEAELLARVRSLMAAKESA